MIRSRNESVPAAASSSRISSGPPPAAAAAAAAAAPHRPQYIRGRGAAARAAARTAARAAARTEQQQHQEQRAASAAPPALEPSRSPPVVNGGGLDDSAHSVDSASFQYRQALKARRRAREESLSAAAARQPGGGRGRHPSSLDSVDESDASGGAGSSSAGSGGTGHMVGRRARASSMDMTVPLSLSCDVGEEDEVSCVTYGSKGSSNGGGKSSRSKSRSRASRGRSQPPPSRRSKASQPSCGGQRQHAASVAPSWEACDSMYLLRTRRTTTGIKFSGGMGPEECAKYYRLRNLDFVVDKPSSQADPARAEEAISPAKRMMIERLRRMGRPQVVPSSVAAAAGNKSAAGDSDDGSAATDPTVDMDDSNSSGISALSMGSSDALATCAATTPLPRPVLGGAKSEGPGVGSAPCRRRPRFTLNFSSSVSVHSIPAASSYPKAVRDSIWYTKLDWTIQKKVSQLELLHDGLDWRNALEEEGYVTCPRTKKLVHPVHVMEGREELLKNGIELLGGGGQQQQQQQQQEALPAETVRGKKASGRPRAKSPARSNARPKARSPPPPPLGNRGLNQKKVPQAA